MPDQTYDLQAARDADARRAGYGNFRNTRERPAGDPMSLAMRGLTEALMPYLDRSATMPEPPKPNWVRGQESNPRGISYGPGGLPTPDEVAGRLEDPGIEPAPPADPMDAQMEKARAGFSFKGTPDWAAEREGFLAQGNADRMGREQEADRLGEQAVFPQGRQLEDTMRDDLRIGGLQRARDMQNPAFARKQRSADTLASAETYMAPQMQQMRQQQQTEGLAGKAGLEELGLMFAGDPRKQQLDQRNFMQQLQLAKAKSPYGFMSGGAPANSPAPRGTGGMTEESIRAQVLAAGGDENDVLETIADAQQRGMLGGR